jgi:hypothetical protein
MEKVYGSNNTAITVKYVSTGSLDFFTLSDERGFETLIV